MATGAGRGDRVAGAPCGAVASRRSGGSMRRVGRAGDSDPTRRGGARPRARGDRGANRGAGRRGSADGLALGISGAPSPRGRARGRSRRGGPLGRGGRPFPTLAASARASFVGARVGFAARRDEPGGGRGDARAGIGARNEQRRRDMVALGDRRSGRRRPPAPPRRGRGPSRHAVGSGRVGGAAFRKRRGSVAGVFGHRRARGAPLAGARAIAARGGVERGGITASVRCAMAAAGGRTAPGRCGTDGGCRRGSRGHGAAHLAPLVRGRVRLRRRRRGGARRTLADAAHVRCRARESRTPRRRRDGRRERSERRVGRRDRRSGAVRRDRPSASGGTRTASLAPRIASRARFGRGGRNRYDRRRPRAARLARAVGADDAGRGGENARRSRLRRRRRVVERLEPVRRGDADPARVGRRVRHRERLGPGRTGCRPRARAGRRERAGRASPRGDGLGGVERFGEPKQGSRRCRERRVTRCATRTG